MVFSPGGAICHKDDPPWVIKDIVGLLGTAALVVMYQNSKQLETPPEPRTIKRPCNSDYDGREQGPDFWGRMWLSFGNGSVSEVWTRLSASSGSQVIAGPRRTERHR